MSILHIIVAMIFLGNFFIVKNVHKSETDESLVSSRLESLESVRVFRVSVSVSISCMGLKKSQSQSRSRVWG